MQQLILRWFWYLGPANPIVLRIMYGGSRRVRHMWVRFTYVGVLGALVFFGLLQAGNFAGDLSLTAMAKAGGNVFQFIAFGQVLMICLLAPLFMAGAIAQEQAGQTFDILLTTPLSNMQIVLGSLLSRLFFVLVLLLSGVPLFAVLMIFGGVPLHSVFVSFAVAGLVAILVGSMAITLAVMRTGGRKAVFGFVVIIMGYLVGCYLLDHTLRLVQRSAPQAAGVQQGGAFVPTAGPSMGYTTVLTPLHPLLVLEASFRKTDYLIPDPDDLANRHWAVRFYLTRPLGTFAVLSVGLSLILILWSTLFVRTMGEGVIGAASGDDKFSNWIRRTLRLNPPGERVRPGRTVGNNPIAWRESNTRGNATGAILSRTAFVFVGLILGFMLILAYHNGWLPAGGGLKSHEVFKDALLALILVEMAVIVLVAIYMSAGCVSKEREDGTLDLILTTPITPSKYIWGKVRGLVGFLALMLTVPILTLAMVSAYTVIGAALYPDSSLFLVDYAGPKIKTHLILPEAPLLFPFMLVPFVAACVVIGMQRSLSAGGVLGAVVQSIVVIAPIVTVLGFCGMSMAHNVNVIGSLINAFSPVTNVLMLISPWDHVKDFRDSSTSTRAASRIALACFSAMAAVGYTGIVYLVIYGMVDKFDQTMRKLSGTA